MTIVCVNLRLRTRCGQSDGKPIRTAGALSAEERKRRGGAWFSACGDTVTMRS
jgi:hypothetical protein